MFNDCSIGVNPDMRASLATSLVYELTNYRIYDFVGRYPKRSPHGRIFYHNPNEERRYLLSTDLLRDHLRQCVLRHVKDAGESNDAQRCFDPDIDLRVRGFNVTSGSWWSGLEGKRQLQAELAGRLWGAVAAQNQIPEVGNFTKSNRK